MSGGQQTDSAAGTLTPSESLSVTGVEGTGATGTLVYGEIDEGQALTGEALTMSGGVFGVGLSIDLPT